MRTFKYILAIVMLLTLAGPGWGAVHYVRTDSTDGGDGTEDRTDGATRAFATIGGVNAHALSAGDQVLFKRGQTWHDNEKFTMGYSGSAGNPIIYGAYGTGDKPLFYGTVLLTSGSWAGGPTIWTQNYGTVYGLLQDGVSLPHATDATCADGNWYCDGVKVYYKPTDAALPSTHAVDLSNQYAFWDCSAISPLQYVTVQDWRIIGGKGVYNGDGRYMTGVTFQRLDFSDVGLALQIKAGGGNSSIDVKDCTFTRCGANIYLELAGTNTNTSNIQGNTITYSNQTGFSGNWDWLSADSGAIQVMNPSNTLIENNSISGRAASDGGISLWANATVTGNIVRKNYIAGLVGPGITCGGDAAHATSYAIYYNIINGCGTGGSAVTPKGAFRLYHAQSSSTPSTIYNNTIYGCDTTFNLSHASADYYTLKNNISKDPTYYHVYGGPDGAHVVLNYNLYHPDTGTKFSSNYTDYNFADYKTATSQDANSPTPADPSFLNAGGSYALATDFRLQAGSPCINAGVDVGLTTDYAGAAVPQ